MRVVFIGINPQVAEMVRLSVHLRWPDVVPLAANTAAEGLATAEQASPDMVFLHPDLPDMSLSETLLELRRISAVPVIVMIQQGNEMEAITALEAGADDYVRLPCDLTELTLRTWALLHRSRVNGHAR